MRLRWLKKASGNLDAELEFIAQSDPDAAYALYDHILACVAGLKLQPGMGRPGRVFGTRELVIVGYPYIIPYRVKNGEIHILRIFHTSRRLPDKW